jgi:hypothetical protein
MHLIILFFYFLDNMVPYIPFSNNSISASANKSSPFSEKNNEINIPFIMVDFLNLIVLLLSYGWTQLEIQLYQAIH